MSRLRGALAPLLDRLDGGARSGPPPTTEEDGTRFPRAAWDLRTIIAVFGPDAPFRFLNLNTTLGLTGLPFDQPARWSGDPGDAFDMQLCLEGRGRTATYKRYHRIGEELESVPGAVRLRLGEQLALEGDFPHYQVEWREPGLSLDITIEADGGVQRWAWTPRYYSHYTCFGRCRIAWRWGSDGGEIESSVLHDHGWGRRPPRWASPLGLFRYEVLRLPDDGVAITLWSEGPGGVTLRNVGLVRRHGVTLQMRYASRVDEEARFLNYAGEGRRVPGHWTGKLMSPRGTLRYRATRAGTPQPVLGDGFLYAFDYQAEGTGDLAASFSGDGYVEQLGAAWSTDRRAPRGASNPGNKP